MSYQDDLAAAGKITEMDTPKYPVGKQINVNILVTGDELYIRSRHLSPESQHTYGVDGNVFDTAPLQTNIVGSLNVLRAIGAIQGYQLVPTPPCS